MALTCSKWRPGTAKIHHQLSVTATECPVPFYLGRGGAWRERGDDYMPIAGSVEVLKIRL